MKATQVSTVLALALVAGRLDAVPIAPGDTFRFEFDFEGASPIPPYLAIDYQIVFGSADLLEQGEGWSVQVFSASGVPLSPVVVFRSPFTDPTTGILTTLKQILYEPLPEAVGYLQFSDIEGTFDLSCTAFVRAWTTLDIEQAEEGVTLTPLVPARVLPALPGVLFFVDDDAPAGGDGTNWATAFTYLQDALAVAVCGDEIRVAGGTYRPDRDETGIVTPGDRTATFQLKNGVVLMGGYGGLGASDPDLRDVALYETILSGDLAADDSLVPCTADSPDCDAFGCLCGSDGFCVISANNGENSFHVVVGSRTGSTTILDGFTISGGNAAGGGFPDVVGAGMFNLDGRPTVNSCTFTGNIAGAGGGMYNDAGSPTVTDCTFSGNSAGWGGAMHNDGFGSNPTVTNCTFMRNAAEFGGAMSNGVGSSATVTYCTFSANSATGLGGGMLNMDGRPAVNNCTFSGNSARSYGGEMLNLDGRPPLNKRNFTGNVAGDIEVFIAGGGGMVNARGPTGIGPPCGDGVLDPGEECDGPQDATCPGLCRIDCRCDAPGITTVSNCAFSDNIADLGGAILNGFDTAMVTNCTFSGNTATFYGGAIFNETANPTVTGCDFDGNGAVVGGAIADITSTGITPAPTSGASTIVPFAGWMPTHGLVMPMAKSFALSGTFVSTTQGAVRGGTINPDVGTTITDCTFSGNIAFHATDISGGGAIANASLNTAVTRCRFAGNTALGTPDFPGFGGAVHNEGGLTATSCTFDANSAGVGGGVASLTFLIATNCTFSGNSALVGGAMVVEGDGSSTVTNCTFNVNTAAGIADFPDVFGGAMLYEGTGSLTVNNSIFWGDSPDEIVNVDPDMDMPTVRFSNVQGGLPPGTIDGGGNIDADPMFAGADLRLGAGSPCIDAGDNSVVSVPIDLDGNMRIVDDPATSDCQQAPGTCGTPPIVDMGAYEYGSAPCGLADLDCDGDVDLHDFARFQACFGTIDPLGCNPTATPDLDGDGQVDLDDYVLFGANLTGPGSQPVPMGP